MSKRALRRVRGLDDASVAALESMGVSRCGELLLNVPQELLPALLPDKSRPFCDNLWETVARAIAPKAISAHTLLEGVGALPIGVKTFDDLMGGVPRGAITELVGPSGAGKSNLCLTAAAAVLESSTDGGVLWVDTESRFSGARLAEVLRERGRTTEVDACLERVHVRRCDTASAFAAELERLGADAVECGAVLLVVDSVAAIARREFSSSEMIERTQLLNQCAETLKLVAGEMGAGVLVTNQVMVDRDGEKPEREKISGNEGHSGHFLPALGNTWAHAVNHRLVLDSGGDEHSHRRLFVAKSPLCPRVGILFEIGPPGFHCPATLPTTDIVQEPDDPHGPSAIALAQIDAHYARDAEETEDVADEEIDWVGIAELVP